MKIKPAKGPVEKIKMRTKHIAEDGAGLLAEWWKSDDVSLAKDVCGTAAYLKTNQTYRIRQLAVDVRLYAGLNVYNYAGSTVAKMDRTKTLPDDRPTFNLIQACTDTLVSRLSQNKPQPKFLTDNADYKQRHLAQRLNQFILGEFYQTKFYEKATKILRDSIVMGTGCLKIYAGADDKVCVDRVMPTDLYMDDNDSLNGCPQQLIQLKLMDRDKAIAKWPEAKEILINTPNSYPDNAPDNARTTADQIMIVEAWRLASGEKQDDPSYCPGKHVIATIAGVLDKELYHKTKFPFVFLNYSDPFLGFFGQGLATQLFGTQLTLNRILYTIARSITLVGVPRVFIEQSSKVTKTSIDNQLGVICTFSGTKPSYEVAPCNAPELYAERDKLIQYGFQQCGVSSMQATSQKPEGLNSGAAIRSYDDISTDRMAAFSKKFDDAHIEAAYLIVDCAMEIAKATGKYQTVYPNKDGTKEIDLPAMKYLNDPFVIQCFSESSLPRTPAGRMQWVTEQVQAGMLTIKEGRRLMRSPQDLGQNEQLDNASEERIFQILDKIVEEGVYTPPDTFMDLQLATTLVVQYYNLYMAAKLEQKKQDMLVQFFQQIQALQQAAQPPPQPAGPPPQANAAPLPTSPLVPNAVGQPAA